MKTLKLLFTISLLFSVMSCSYYRDYSREQGFKDADNKGKSILIQAENEKKAIITQAEAENEANESVAKSLVTIAEANKQVKIIDAEAIAEANRIIGQSLKDNPEYLIYLKIEAIKHAKAVYIPTEASVPILEIKN